MDIRLQAIFSAGGYQSRWMKMLGVALGLGIFAYSVAGQAGTASDAAFLRACGLERSPRGSVFKDNGDTSDNWRWKQGLPQDNFKFMPRTHGIAAYTNPVCELFILGRLSDNKDATKARCEDKIAEALYYEDTANGSGSSGSSGGVNNALDAFMKTSGSSSSVADAKDPCGGTISDTDIFACNYDDFSKRLEDPSEKKAASKAIAATCAGVGANMDFIPPEEYRSRASAGLDYRGNGFCGTRKASGSDPMTQRDSNAGWNVALAAFKLAAPIASQTLIAYMGQKNADRTGKRDYNLGVASGLVAGQIGGGYYSGGHGGGIYSGGAYSGLSGGCPYGACAGNGGIQVGGGGGIGIAGGGGYSAGGYSAGGGCGIPPYALSYVGCGAGGGAGGGGVIQVPSGAGGGAGYGVGNYGGLGGVGGFPGPYGTGDGSNGWGQGGNPYAANGMYGGPQQYGVSNVNNAQYMAAYAKALEDQAQAYSRKAAEATQAEKLYKSQLKDYEAAGDRATQGYLAYQMAQWGLSSASGGFPTGGGVGGGGVGGGGGSSGCAVCSGGTAVGTYYPPYTSGGSVGSGFSVSGGVTYSSGGSRATGGASSGSGSSGVSIRK